MATVMNLSSAFYSDVTQTTESLASRGVKAACWDAHSRWRVCSTFRPGMVPSFPGRAAGLRPCHRHPTGTTTPWDSETLGEKLLWLAVAHPSQLPTIDCSKPLGEPEGE